jgi:hypothetical protein
MKKVLFVLALIVHLGLSTLDPVTYTVIRNEQRVNITCHKGFYDTNLAELKIKAALQFNILYFRDLRKNPDFLSVANRFSLLLTRNFI